MWNRLRLLGLAVLCLSAVLALSACGGGGGFGDPRERDRETVRRDLDNGVISADAARELYGLDEQ